MNKPEKTFKAIMPILQKYKYAIVILLIGIGLLLIPARSNQTSPESVSTDTASVTFDSYGNEMETKLISILSRIQGVGNVDVILTLKQAEVNHYLADHSLRTSTTEAGSTGEETEKTVIISKGSSYDEPIVTGRDYPVFQGALIVCDGGGDAQIRLQLTQAVSALTGLSSHNITILKMK